MYPLTAWATKEIFVGIQAQPGLDIVIGLKRQGQPAMHLTVDQFAALETHWEVITKYLNNEEKKAPHLQLDQHLVAVGRDCFGQAGMYIENNATAEVFIFTHRSWFEMCKLRSCVQYNIREKINARTALLYCLGEARKFVANRPQTMSREQYIQDFPRVFLSKASPCRETYELLNYFYPMCSEWIYEHTDTS